MPKLLVDVTILFTIQIFWPISTGNALPDTCYWQLNKLVRFTLKNTLAYFRIKKISGARGLPNEVYLRWQPPKGLLPRPDALQQFQVLQPDEVLLQVQI